MATENKTLTRGTAWTDTVTQTAQTKKYSFDTEGKYIDKNIELSIKAQDAVLGTNTNSVSGSNCTLSTTNTSGVSVTGSGHGNVSTEGWIAAGDVGSGSSTKYISGITLDSGKSISINDGIYDWTLTVDASGNVSLV